jgi:hypothetical protein
MDEAKRRVGVPAVLGLLAAVIAVAALWATSAFAAGGSSPGERRSSDGSQSAYVQDDGRDGAARDGDCPDRGGEPEESSDA